MGLAYDNVVGLAVAGGLANFLQLYNLVITVRVLLSWFPMLANNPVVAPIFTVSDVYLNIFRGLIPPIAGIDFSVIPAFLLLNFASQAVGSFAAELPDTHRPAVDVSAAHQQRQRSNGMMMQLPRKSAAFIMQ